MDNFIKRTTGEVQQCFEKNENGDFVCVGQWFVAGDVSDYIGDNGGFVSPPEYTYQPYNMVIVQKDEG